MTSLERSINWGRSKLGCDACKDPRALAGWHVKLGTQTVSVICSDCVAGLHPWEALEGAPGSQPAPTQLSAA